MTKSDFLKKNLYFEEGKMNYIIITKDPPSTRCSRVETTKSEQYLEIQDRKNREEITINLCPKW